MPTSASRRSPELARAIRHADLLNDNSPRQGPLLASKGTVSVPLERALPARSPELPTGAPAERNAIAYQSFDTLPGEAWIRLPVVAAIYGGISPATVWRWVSEKRIPAPHKIGPKVTAWRVEEVRRALASA